MRLLFFLGVGLLIAAFVATASEVVARAVPGVGSYVSAHELWAALSPRTFRDAQRWVEATLGPAAWDPVLMSAMFLPAWALLGIPGGVIAWFTRPNREPPEDFDPDEAFLFDELARRAREEGYDDGRDDDRLPADTASEIMSSAREAGHYAADGSAFAGHANAEPGATEGQAPEEPPPAPKPMRPPQG